MLVGFYLYSCTNHSFLLTVKYCSVVLPQRAYTLPCRKTSLTAAVMNEAADTHTDSLRTHIFHIFQLLSLIKIKNVCFFFSYFLIQVTHICMHFIKIHKWPFSKNCPEKCHSEARWYRWALHEGREGWSAESRCPDSWGRRAAAAQCPGVGLLSRTAWS